MTNILVCKANARPLGEYQLGNGSARVVATLHKCPATPTLDAACMTGLSSVWPKRDNTLRVESSGLGTFRVVAEVVTFVEREWPGAQWFVSEWVKLDRQLPLLAIGSDQLFSPVFIAFLGGNIVAIAAPEVET